MILRLVEKLIRARHLIGQDTECALLGLRNKTQSAAGKRKHNTYDVNELAISSQS